MQPTYTTNRFQSDLPNATTVMVLGILSIIFAGLIGVILAIIALNMAGKAKTLYQNDPDSYMASSYSKVNSGRVCAIIGLSIVGILFLVMLGFVFAAG